jgi:hypothetical protein
MADLDDAARLKKIGEWAGRGIACAALEGVWSFYKLYAALADHDHFEFGLRVAYVIIAVVIAAFLLRILFLAKSR